MSFGSVAVRLSGNSCVCRKRPKRVKALNVGFSGPALECVKVRSYYRCGVIHSKLCATGVIFTKIFERLRDSSLRSSSSRSALVVKSNQTVA